MKLLIYDWDTITKFDLYAALREQKIQFDLFSSPAKPRYNDQKERFRNDLEEALKNRKYDALFSVNYFAEMAEAAHDKGCLYVCWTYDSPALGGQPGLQYETNRIFLFDSREYESYKNLGVQNIFYLPLAVNARRLIRMKPAPMEQLQYRADVSFVGQLYQSDMDRILPLFDEYGAGYIAAVINTQLNIYGIDLAKELINDNVIKRLCNDEVTKLLLEKLNDNYLQDQVSLDGWALAMFLEKAVTNKERVLLLTLLAKYYQVKLYTTGEPKLPNVSVYGVVDYVKRMPLVFKCSKINLNVTLRNIRSGIPQRVIDIMGCRALALTNYQADLDRHFEDGKELLVYSSIEEAVDKCKYYLSHEKEAEIIRANAYKAVRDQFSYEHQLNQIWELSGMKDLLPK